MTVKEILVHFYDKMVVDISTVDSHKICTKEKLLLENHPILSKKVKSWSVICSNILQIHCCD